MFYHAIKGDGIFLMGFSLINHATSFSLLVSLFSPSFLDTKHKALYLRNDLGYIVYVISQV